VIRSVAAEAFVLVVDGGRLDHRLDTPVLAADVIRRAEVSDRKALGDLDRVLAISRSASDPLAAATAVYPRASSILRVVLRTV
jgi:hypothetical protein